MTSAWVAEKPYTYFIPSTTKINSNFDGYCKASSLKRKGCIPGIKSPVCIAFELRIKIIAAAIALKRFDFPEALAPYTTADFKHLVFSPDIRLSSLLVSEEGIMLKIAFSRKDMKFSTENCISIAHYLQPQYIAC